jgi:hypothetical protein
MNGFPPWTLWGAGLSALGALIAIILAYIAQTPRFLKRTGLTVYRLDLQVRSFTGYALALLLLAMGFFLAGVPLGPQPSGESVVVVATPTPTPPSGEPAVMTTPDSDALTALPAAVTPESGAFPGLPPELQTPTNEATNGSNLVEDEANAPTPPIVPPTGTATAGPTTAATTTPAATATTTPTSTPTLTPTPTQTPTPTMTPTPIEGQTAVINTQGSNVWVRRMPGGQTLFLVSDREVVILLPGRANQGGLLWREISNLDGLTGWIQADFLAENNP